MLSRAEVTAHIGLYRRGHPSGTRVVERLRLGLMSTSGDVEWEVMVREAGIEPASPERALDP